MAEHGIEYWKKIVWKVANITPHDKKDILEWLDKYDKYMKEHQKEYDTYRGAKYLIPALAMAIKKGDEGLLSRTIKERKLRIGPNTESNLKNWVIQRNYTRKKLKESGIKLNSMTLTKLIDNDGTPKDKIPNKNKIKITTKEKEGLLSAKFDALEIEDMFLVDDRSIGQKIKDKLNIKSK